MGFKLSGHIGPCAHTSLVQFTFVSPPPPPSFPSHSTIASRSFMNHTLSVTAANKLTVEKFVLYTNIIYNIHFYLYIYIYIYIFIYIIYTLAFFFYSVWVCNSPPSPLPLPPDPDILPFVRFRSARGTMRIIHYV